MIFLTNTKICILTFILDFILFSKLFKKIKIIRLAWCLIIDCVICIGIQLILQLCFGYGFHRSLFLGLLLGFLLGLVPGLLSTSFLLIDLVPNSSDAVKPPPSPHVCAHPLNHWCFVRTHLLLPSHISALQWYRVLLCTNLRSLMSSTYQFPMSSIKKIFLGGLLLSPRTASTNVV